jgi:hypothetical protein
MHRVLGCLLTLSLLSCAHQEPGVRRSRILLGVGAATFVAGGLTAAGCVSGSASGDGCGGGPGDGDLATGVPLMVVGAGLITAGWLLKPNRGSILLPSPPPTPPTPDPWVQPVRRY